MQNRDIVAIGTSAGGVDALLFLAKNFPREFPAAILVTLHIPRRSRSELDQLLSRTGPLAAKFVESGQALAKGCIHIAPADHHLILEDGRFYLGTGPRENHSRPAIDPMFRSIALCCGHRAIGVVLTGTLGDGASGLWSLKACGGVSVVQDPEDAAYADMPINALNLVKPDHVVSLREMPLLLNRLVQLPASDAVMIPDRMKIEVEVAKGRPSSMAQMDKIGNRSVIACPDCHGVMWELEEGDMARYRCHVGHTYSAEMLSVLLDENIRNALASALRAMEERLALMRKLESQAMQGSRGFLTNHWNERAQEVEKELAVLRTGLQQLEQVVATAERS